MKWIITAVIVSAWLIIGALEDGPTQEQIAADEIKAAQVQARLEAAEAKLQLKTRIAYANHLLALDRK